MNYTCSIEEYPNYTYTHANKWTQNVIYGKILNQSNNKSIVHIQEETNNGQTDRIISFSSLSVFTTDCNTPQSIAHVQSTT